MVLLIAIISNILLTNGERLNIRCDVNTTANATFNKVIVIIKLLRVTIYHGVYLTVDSY